MTETDPSEIADEHGMTLHYGRRPEVPTDEIKILSRSEIPIPDDWEDQLAHYCDPDRIQDFFDIRNSVREAMWQRGHLLKVIGRILERAERVNEGEQWWLSDEKSDVAAAQWLIAVISALPPHMIQAARESIDEV